MPLFSNLTNRSQDIQKFRDALVTLKEQGKTLLDAPDIERNAIYANVPRTFFEELINSALFREIYRPSEILQIIVDAELAFNITEQQLSQLYNNNSQLQLNPNHSTKKADDLVAEILVRNFAVDARIMVDGQTIFDRHIVHTTPARLIKTLTKLIELELVPQGNQLGLQGNQLVPQGNQLGLQGNIFAGNGANILAVTADPLISAVVQKITTSNLPQLIRLLKDKCDQSMLAHRFMESGRVGMLEVLTIFHKNDIRLDLNQNQNHNSILTFLTNDIARIFENGGVKNFHDIMDAASKHQVDWSSNFVSQILNNIPPHIMSRFLPEIIDVFADYYIDLVVVENGFGVRPALHIIRDHLNGDYKNPMSKAVMESIARAGVSFEDALVRFWDKVQMHDLVKAYADNDIAVNFNLGSQEFINGMMYAPDYIGPLADMVHPAGMHQENNLLGYIFGRNVTDKEQFRKLVKELKRFEDIDWTQKLHGMGNNILAQIAYFEDIHQDALELLRITDEKYGLKFEINSFDLLQTLMNQITDLQNPEEIMRAVMETGFVVNKEMAILAFASCKNVSLSDAATLLHFENINHGLDVVKIQDLPSVSYVIMNSKNAAIISANLKQLNAYGFNKWNEGPDNCTLLHLMIDQCMNFNEVSALMLALNRTAGIEWDFEIDRFNQINQTPLDSILRKADIIGDVVANSNYALNLIKLLKTFGVADWVEVTVKIINSSVFNGSGRLKMDILKALPQEVDFAHQRNGASLITNIVRDAGEYVEFVQQLPSLHISDWNLVAKDILGYGYNIVSIYIVDTIKLLVTKEVDFTAEIRGSSLLADIAGMVGNNQDMGEVVRLLSDKVDFTAIENQKLFLFSISYCSLEAIAASFSVVGINHLDWNEIVSPEFLQKIISHNSLYMLGNLRFLEQHVPGVDWFNMQDSILFKTKQSGAEWRVLLDFVRDVERNDHLPKFNINSNEGGGSNRKLIDLAENAGPEIIKSLRDLGSVEPNRPIMIAVVDGVEKLDISNGRLDGYEPNQNNAPRILEALYAKFPLGGDIENLGYLTEELHMDRLINEFRASDFAGWENREWSYNRVMTIPDVIDDLSHPSLRDVYDRLSLNGQAYSWNFKKVLASMIHAINTTDDQDGMLRNNLIHCLSELKMCQLGKLINLLYVIQDVVLDSHQVNYESINLEDGAFANFLDIVYNEIRNELGEERASVAVARWYFDMKGGNVNQAHTWSPETQYLHGVMNRLFDGFVIESIGALAGKNESYHFTNGLVGQIIAPFVEILGQEVQGERFANWKNMLEHGEANIIREFFAACIHAENEDALGVLFEDVSHNKLKLYADFHAVDLDCVREYFDRIRQVHHADGLENKFIELLKEHCVLSPNLELALDAGANILLAGELGHIG
jgi:hypothetical protein